MIIIIGKLLIYQLEIHIQCYDVSLPRLKKISYHSHLHSNKFPNFEQQYSRDDDGPKRQAITR